MNETVFKRYPHNPPHLFVDNTWYMITGATYKKKPLFASDGAKQLLLDITIDFYSRHNWQIKAWVILSNHYHLIAKSYLGKDLPAIIRDVHGKSSKFLKRDFDLQFDRCWWNYWDTCIRSERDYYKRLNYVYYNPIKQGLVENLKDYEWSSFQKALIEQGRAALVTRFSEHPVDDFDLGEEDDF